jgi:uncharacterized protein (DUF1697 family)
MSKYIAFLSAINVGRHTVKMDALRQMFESPGYADEEISIFETWAGNASVTIDVESQ